MALSFSSLLTESSWGAMGGRARGRWREKEKLRDNELRLRLRAPNQRWLVPRKKRSVQRRKTRGEKKKKKKKKKGRKEMEMEPTLEEEEEEEKLPRGLIWCVRKEGRGRGEMGGRD